MPQATGSTPASCSPSPSVHPPETKSPEQHTGHTSPLPPQDPAFAAAYLPDVTPAEVFRHSGWAGDRLRVLAALKRTLRPPDRILRFVNCGYGAYVLKSDDDPPRYRTAGSSCHDRFCLPCSQARSHTIALNVLDRLRDRPVRFLTLTVNTSQQTLHMSIDHLVASFQRLRRTASWQLHVTGGVAFLEIKWQPDTARWHPHLHCLIEGTYFPHATLKALWTRVTGGSSIVWITRVSGGPHVARYVTKYAAKPLNSSYLRDPARLDEAITALEGRRLSITFGRWRGVALTPKPPEKGWTNIGTVDSWLHRATDGDVQAINVMAQINAPATATAMALIRLRSPPPEAPPRNRDRQDLLFPIRNPTY